MLRFRPMGQTLSAGRFGELLESAIDQGQAASVAGASSTIRLQSFLAKLLAGGEREPPRPQYTDPHAFTLYNSMLRDRGRASYPESDEASSQASEPAGKEAFVPQGAQQETSPWSRPRAPRALTGQQRSALAFFNAQGESTLDASFTQGDIKRAFRRLAKALHPDMAAGKGETVWRRRHRDFVRLLDAYRILRAAVEDA